MKWENHTYSPDTFYFNQAPVTLPVNTGTERTDLIFYNFIITIGFETLFALTINCDKTIANNFKKEGHTA